MFPVTEDCPGKYGKRLIGRTDMEDALKRLDKLTHEEARMAIAENLRATHAVDERVKGVSEQVLAVDDRVARVDNRLADVDDRVAGVDDRLANVDDRVANVNDKVTEVIHGVCQSQSCETFNPSCSGGKEAMHVMEQTANDVANVNDKITEVIHGACQSSSFLRHV
jgi:archaellum component FlaC